jgi:hypothetical protein
MIWREVLRRLLDDPNEALVDYPVRSRTPRPDKLLRA